MGLFESLWCCGSQENIMKEKIYGNSLYVIQVKGIWQGLGVGQWK